MSLLTKFLGLFKYDPVTDKDSTFNITKALNENWDKIDSKVEEMNTAIDNVEVPVTSVNNKTGDVVLDASSIGAETPEGAQAKADIVQDDLDGHKADTTKHITAEERNAWNAKPSSQRAVSDSVSSTSSSTAASSKAVKTAYDKANQAFQSASDGKQQIATAITGMGQGASGSDTFATLASKIKDISDDATATTSNVLSGKTFYQGGAKKTGNMPNRGAHNITPGASNKVIPSGYHSGGGVVYGDTDLKPDNIRKGVNIFGTSGSLDGKKVASGNTTITIIGRMTYANGSEGLTERGIEVSGLAFIPAIVLMFNLCRSSVSIYSSKAFLEDWSEGKIIKLRVPDSDGGYINHYRISGGAYVRYGGFHLPINGFNDESVYWIAYG